MGSENALGRERIFFMSYRSRTSIILKLSFCLLFAAFLMVPLELKAKDGGDEYRVRSGDTLTRIARRYGVRVENLAAANRISKDSTLRLGQVLVIPESGVIYVRPGDTIGALARTYHTTIDELLEVNNLKRNSIIRVGQELILPGHEPVSGGRKWGRPKQRGVVHASRIGGATMQMRLLDASGRPRAEARRRLSVLMQHRQTGAKKLPDPRLLRVLTRVSDYFGGRRILIISGYRKPGGYTRDTSRHTAGQALDIRIPGVPNTALRDYCRRLSRTGCGYYPRSTFVHIDVRQRSAYWVDWSRPGEAPIYGKRPPEERTVDDSASDRDDDAPEISASEEA